MKLCYLADATSIHTRRWCSWFAAAGHEVHVFSLKREEIPGVKVHLVDAGEINVSGGNWKVLLKYRRVKKMINELKPDLVHALYATSYGSLGALSGFHPLVVTGLGTDVLISPKESFAYRKIVKYVMKRADWITVFSPFMADVLRDMGIEEKKVNTVLLGIDEKIFNSIGRRPHDGFVITSTRNFEPVYNLSLFIHAVAKVKDRISGLRVIMTGDGSQRKEMEKLSKELGLEGVVSFLGKVPQEKLADLLRETDIFCSTSLSDGNNISLNEAMACGAIPVVTDIEANRIWIKDQENGFLVPLDSPEIMSERILYVYNEYSSLRNRFVAKNERIVMEKALFSVNMKRVEEHYKKLVAGK